MRTHFDFAPSRRSTVGFDQLFDLLEGTARTDTSDGFPLYDLERKSDDSYCITLAVAGFQPDEIEIVSHNNQLTVTGKKVEDQDTRQYLHRGIATRPFESKFQLADFVQVRDASFDNGLLRIDLQREIPEAMKPRRVAINSAKPPANDRIGASASEIKAA